MTSSFLHNSQADGRCEHKCLCPSSGTNHEGTKLKEGIGSLDSSLGRGWKSWYMPMFSFQERNCWWANISYTDLPQTLALSLIWLAIKAYVTHLLGTYVTILCNRLIFWQNALYLYLGRFRMCLNTSRNHVSRSSVEAFKSVKENKLKV